MRNNGIRWATKTHPDTQLTDIVAEIPDPRGGWIKAKAVVTSKAPRYAIRRFIAQLQWYLLSEVARHVLPQ